MNSQVDASTVSAGAFFAENRLLVPDFQRRYSWEADQQISDFWRDLSKAIGVEDYFLGLVILSDRLDRREIVDGQQRLVTLTILANELRLIATRLGRRLVAESIRSDFLYSMDFETEDQVPRILLTDQSDREELQVLLNAASEADLSLREGSSIHAAHRALAESLAEDISRHENPALRVGQWSEFITKSVTFAVFKHPDRGAAFRVYEVINTRGKDLTPTELIKSFLIGGSDRGVRDDTYRRWNEIEEQLTSVGAQDQLTTFVRQVVTLDRGYVIPRDLYRVVTTAYAGPIGVARLLDRLEANLPVYLQMLDPSADVESSETLNRAYLVSEALSLARFRPVLLAAAQSDDPESNTRRLMEILIPGSITGRFATGSIDAQFARAARRLNQDRDWATELQKLQELEPSREEFKLRLLRGINKSQALVLRSAFLQNDRLPELIGFAHQVRPRNGDGWVDFDFDQYLEAGGLLGNWVLTKVERRPQGSRTPESVVTRMLPNLIQSESLTQVEIENWSADWVRTTNGHVAEQIAELWYGTL